MATERRILQLRCAELRDRLPAGAKCSHSNEKLREYIKYTESARNPPKIIPTPVVSGLELSNDLIEAVALYAIPTVTMDLGALTSDLTQRLLYSIRFWKDKVIVLRSGLLFDDQVMARSPWSNPWYVYYRLFNRLEYGAAYSVWWDGSTTLLEPRAISVSALNKDICVTTPEGLVVSYPLKIRAREIGKKKVLATGNHNGLILKVVGVASIGAWVCLSERGAVFQVRDTEVIVLTESNAVDIISPGANELDILMRDGSVSGYFWTSTGSGGLKSPRQSMRLKIVAMFSVPYYSDGTIPFAISNTWARDLVISDSSSSKRGLMVTVFGTVLSNLEHPRVVLPALGASGFRDPPVLRVMYSDGTLHRYRSNKIERDPEITGVKLMGSFHRDVCGVIQ